MDMIYTDENGIDQGVLLDYELDMEIGGTEDYQIILREDMLQQGAYIYAENTEIFGIIENRKVNTEEGSITYTGRTVRGIFEKKIVEPPKGEGYRIVSGNVVDIFNSLSTEFGLNNLIEFKSTKAYTINQFQIDRYVSFLSVIKKILKQIGAKMTFSYKGKMIITITDSVDYSNESEYVPDTGLNFVVEQYNGIVNHLICLGQGELENRQVLHLYMDTNGNVSETQSLFGVKEITEVYDYSSVESLEELRTGGAEYLKEQLREYMELLLSSDSVNVGDIVGGHEDITGTTIRAEVTQKIIKVKDNVFTVEYKVGE